MIETGLISLFPKFVSCALCWLCISAKQLSNTQRSLANTMVPVLKETLPWCLIFSWSALERGNDLLVSFDIIFQSCRSMQNLSHVYSEVLKYRSRISCGLPAFPVLQFGQFSLCLCVFSGRHALKL